MRKGAGDNFHETSFEGRICFTIFFEMRWCKAGRDVVY